MSFIFFILVLILILPFMLFGTSLFKAASAFKQMRNQFMQQNEAKQSAQEPKKRSFKGPFKNNKGDYVDFEEIPNDENNSKN